jgi:methionyl aminopeptidase
MIPVKTSDEILRMREACSIAALVLEKLSMDLAPGVNTYDLDQTAMRLIEGYGAESSVYNYRVGSRRFPAYTCISVNEEIVHGIGIVSRVVHPGDIVTLDVTVTYEGFIGDNARTFMVGPSSPEVENLVRTTESAMYRGIDSARPGNRVGDISNAVQMHIEERSFSVVRDFVGHGVGRSMHEEPQIPNFGRAGTGDVLKPGMTLAIEPMVSIGSPDVEMAADGWTAITRDRKQAAHFEHTVLVTENGPEILTIIKK